MNKGKFRLVFSRIHGALLPVAETTLARGKTAGGETRGAGEAQSSARRFMPRLLPLLIGLTFATFVGANPNDPTVISGQASFVTLGNTLTISNSANAIINWQGFSINADEITRFVQPNTQSSVLNRVTGGDPSSILGQLQSNGKVFLINPNGILFGQGSRVDVGGLVASTLNLSNQDFLAGNFKFSDGGHQAGVINQGWISSAAGGEVWLIGHDVENSGVIDSPNGQVIIAAGSSVELAPNGAEGISVSFAADDNQAVNLGDIISQGGNINIFAALIQQQGVIQADSLEVGANGRITLNATKTLNLAEGSLTTANSSHADTAGGTIMALADMNDGQAIVAGTLQARAAAGDGGFIETSAARIDIATSASVSAASQGGRAGTWLIDPVDISIVSQGAVQVPENGGDVSPSTQPSTVSVETLQMALNSGSNVTIDTHGGSGGNGDISVDSAINVYPYGSVRLTLNADRNILINQSITASDGGSLDLVLNHGSAGSATLANGRIIDLYGGALDVQRAGASGAGTLAIGSGTLRNATLLANTLNSSTGVLDGLTLGSGVTLSGSIYIEGDLTLAHGITVDKGNGYWYFRTPNATQHISTPGSAVINNAGGWLYGGYGVVGNTLQIDSGITLQGYGGISQSSPATLINAGRIHANTTGQTFTINPATYTGLEGGVLQVSAGTLTLSPTSWSNDGSFDISGGTLNLGGSFSTADIGNVNRTAGTVNISGTLDNSDGTLELGTGGFDTGALSVGGRIIGGEIRSSDVPGTLTVNSGTLQDVTFASDLTLSGGSYIEGDLTLADGVTLNNGNHYWYFRTPNATQHITTPGSAVINNAGGWLYAGYTVSGNSVQIDNGITLQGYGGISQSSPATLINAGRIHANTTSQTFTINPATYTGLEGGVLQVSAGTLTLSPTSWSNDGSFDISGGTLNLGGSFSTADIGNVNRTAGTVNISGTLDNSDGTLELGTGGFDTGALSVGGRIIGGEIRSSDVPGTLTVNSGTLQDVTFASDLTLSGWSYIEGDLTLADGVTLNNGNHYWYFRTPNATQHITTPGSAVINNAGGWLYGGWGVANNVVQIDSGITLQGYGGISQSSPATLINAGTIHANTTSQTFTINPATYTGLEGGVLQASAGTLTLSPTSWSNDGSFDISGGTLNLGGSFSTADIGNVNRTAGTVNISGTLDNSNATLDLGTGGFDTGVLSLSGRIVGGEIRSSDVPGTLTVNSGTLQDVTFASDLMLSGSTFVEGDLTLADGVTLDNGNHYWYFRTPNATQRISTPGSAVINNAGGWLYGGYGVVGNTLQIDSGITLQGYGGISQSSPATLINAGRIHANTTGQTFTINPATYTGLEGSVLQVSAGTLAFSPTSWSNDGSFDISGGTLNLGGSFSTADIGNVNRTAGTVNISGTLNNAGGTLDLGSGGFDTGVLSLSGRIVGGEIRSSDVPGTLTVNSGTLQDVTFASDLTLSGWSYIEGDLTLSDGVTLNNGNHSWYFRTPNATQHITTPGSAVINNAGGWLYGGWGVANNVVQIDSGVTLQGYGGISQSSPATLINAGRIHANTTSQTFTINPATYTGLEGGVLQVSAGTLTLSPTSWSNDGSFDISGGTLNLGGSFSTADIGNVNRTAGTVNISGTLDNSDGTLDLGTGGFDTGALSVSGRIVGGEIRSSGVTGTLTNSNGTLQDVTLASNLTLSGSTYIEGDLTLADGVTLNNGNHSWYFRTPNATQHITTPGSAVINNAGGWLYGGWGVANNVVQIDSGVTLQGYGGISQSTAATVLNAGTVHANTTGQTFTINPSVFDNQGMLEVSAGTLTVSATTYTQAGDLSVSSGAQFNRIGGFTNVGLISGSGTLNVGSGNTLINLGSIEPGGANATGTLSITGHLTLGGESIVNLEVSGIAASDFDSLTVSGDVLLGGTLNVSTLNNYVPATNTTFNVVAGANVAGDFTSRNMVDFTSAVALNRYVLTYIGNACPGTICFDNDAGDWSWTTPANWSTNTLPGSDDAVVVDHPGQTITLASGDHDIYSLLFDADFSFTGGGLNVAGSAVFNGLYNQSASATLTADSVSIASVGNIVLGVINARDVEVIGAADIAVLGGITVADGIVLAAGGDFSNNAGASALVVSNGNWQIWSSHPDQDALDGLSYDFKQYNAEFGVDTPLGVGDGVFYRHAPSLAVALTGTASKEYDGTTAATLTNAAFAISGALGVDSVTLDYSAANYADKHAGNGKSVSVSGLSIASVSDHGAPVYGYQLAATSASGAIGEITPKALIVSGLVANDKIYDGGTAATIDATGVLFNGLIANDNLSINASGAFTDKHVGSNKSVTLSSLYGGLDAGNYNITDQPATSADITPKTLTVSGLVAYDKTYDGTTAATIDTAGVLFNGLIANDVLTISASGVFGDRHVGTGKSVVLSSVYGGLDAGNYSITDQPTTSADITRLASVAWIGGSGAWSDAANWAGGALPDAANVESISLPSGVLVRYDIENGVTQLDSLGSAGTLLIETGGLNVAQLLSTHGYSQSGGSVNAGSLVIENFYNQAGGSLVVQGLADISHTGNLQLTDRLTAQSLKLQVGGGITQTSGLQLASLEAHAGSGITLTDIGNHIGQFSASNGASGAIDLVNSGVLTLGLISNTGDIRIDNTGAVSSGVDLISSSAGNVSIIARSPLTIGAGGIQAAGDILLTAGATAGAGDDLLLNGAIASLGGGGITLLAGDNLAQNANISSQGGNINLSALTGNIAIAPTAVTVSPGGQISLAAPAGFVSGPIPAGAVVIQGLGVLPPFVEQFLTETIDLGLGLFDAGIGFDTRLFEQSVSIFLEDNSALLADASGFLTSAGLEQLSIPPAMMVEARRLATGDVGLSISPNLSQAAMGEMLKLRHEHKTNLFREALKILEQNRRAADLEQCRSEVSANCMRLRSDKKQTRKLATPKVAHLPQIQRKVAVLIGNNDYSGDIPKLKGAVPDVEAMAELLRTRMGYEVRVIKDARKADMVESLNKLVDEIDDNDSVAIYYAGHGYQEAKSGAGFWIPVDGASDDPRGWLSNEDISRYLSNINAKQLLLVADSCYSGSLAKEGQVLTSGRVEAKDVLSGRSVIVMSSGGEEPVTDEGKDNHSIFAWNLMQALRQVDGWTPGSRIFDQVRQEVVKTFPQTPQYGASLSAGHMQGGDFLFEERQY